MVLKPRSEEAGLDFCIYLHLIAFLPRSEETGLNS
jgi:hypothetical protein